MPYTTARLSQMKWKGTVVAAGINTVAATLNATQTNQKSSTQCRLASDAISHIAHRLNDAKGPNSWRSRATQTLTMFVPGSNEKPQTSARISSRVQTSPARLSR